jgi:hypothetical protein
MRARRAASEDPSNAQDPPLRPPAVKGPPFERESRPARLLKQNLPQRLKHSVRVVPKPVSIQRLQHPRRHHPLHGHPAIAVIECVACVHDAVVPRRGESLDVRERHDLTIAKSDSHAERFEVRRAHLRPGAFIVVVPGAPNFGRGFFKVVGGYGYGSCSG